MTLTPHQLAIFSIVLLAVGLTVGAGALIAAELRRARSGQVIGRAIRQAALTPGSQSVTTAEAEAEGAFKPELELPFHWLDSRIGRAFVADEDRSLIDQCGLPSKRTQLIFLVTRIGLALVFPLLAYLLWSSGHEQGTIVTVLAACAVLGFMAPKWVLGRFAAGRRERAARELPLFIDLLRLLQGVGLSLDQSLQIMATDFSHVLHVLGHELGIANAQYSQGRTREHSLHRLATLHKNENLRGLVSLLVQVDRHGGAVQEPLRVFSDRLRESRRSQMKERIGKITVKMTGVMVVSLLPALVIVTAGPGFIAIFRSLGAISK
ncbi:MULTISPECIES: type II secretion system F family protein [unclassified Variovorax]|jgi:tight adherence protein C|uniref:type II secretion system F family protein n=1 Tax=unclassified Variovorax TaxID=663243 RepID=UPI000D135FF7|nr:MULTISPECIES: type II secretion system F family protein [unclassified Variovorax]AVQ83653.1 secretion system protein [Variovorax sp. PMC12]QRY32025.1 type II secretion system F family protein [Variovorax sp. PDNC026]